MLSNIRITYFIAKDKGAGLAWLHLCHKCETRIKAAGPRPRPTIKADRFSICRLFAGDS